MNQHRLPIEDRLRDALHAYGDSIEPAEGWTRIHQARAGRRRGWGGWRIPTVIIVTAGAIIALVLAFGAFNGGEEVRIQEPVGPTDDEAIIAATTEGELVALDANGLQERVILDAEHGPGPNEMTSGDPEVAVSPDGQTIYFTRLDPDPTCSNGEQLIGTIMAVPYQGGDPTALVEVGIDPAVSPTGEYLAYTTTASGDRCNSDKVHEVRSLVTGEVVAQWDRPQGFGTMLWIDDDLLIRFETMADGTTQVHKETVSDPHTSEMNVLPFGITDATYNPAGERVIIVEERDQTVASSQFFHVLDPLTLVSAMAWSYYEDGLGWSVHEATPRPDGPGFLFLVTPDAVKGSLYRHVGPNDVLIAEGVIAAVALPRTGAAAECSGSQLGDLSPIEGLPDAVATTRAQLYDVARTCDWEALDGLMASDFWLAPGATSGVTPNEAVASFKGLEAAGNQPMLRLGLLLDIGFEAEYESASGIDPATFLWSEQAIAETLDLVDPNAEDREVLEVFWSYTQIEDFTGPDADEQMRQDLVYFGWRTAIDSSGQWTYYLSGD